MGITRRRDQRKDVERASCRRQQGDPTVGKLEDVEHGVAKEVRACIQFVFTRTVREVLDAAFGPGSLP